MFCICFFRIIQCPSREGEEDGKLYQGDLKLTGAGDFWEGARGYQGALELTDDFGKGYHWQGELTGAGDFGEERGDIRVFWNSPAPVTLERSERISSC